MRPRNNGQGSANILQNQFTAYLITAIKRKKQEYFNRKIKQSAFEVPVDELSYFLELPIEPDMIQNLPLSEQLADASLILALKQLRERDLYIFLAHTLEEKTFNALADELEISYKGVAAAYYRTVQKIKLKMSEVNHDEF